MANIKLNLPAVPFSGQIVTFTAPCDCVDVEDGLIINGETYTVVDAMGKVLTGKGGAWCEGAKVSVILDCEDKNAYIQGGGSGGAGKVVTGSYIGTGKRGEANPTSITFEDVPKYLVIQMKYTEYEDVTEGVTASTDYYTQAVWVYGTDYFIFDHGDGIGNVTLTDTTLSWYNTTAGSQLNSENREYFYFAILGDASFDISTFSSGGGSDSAIEYNKPVAFTATLVARDWADNTQTITDSRFLADGYSYLVTPASVTLMDYATAFVYASDVVTDGKMVFNCTTAPSVDIAVNIVRMEVEEA